MAVAHDDDDDPFGYAGLGFDHGSGAALIPQPCATTPELPQRPADASNATSASTEAEASAPGQVQEAQPATNSEAQDMAVDHDSEGQDQPGDEGITKSARRKLVLESLAELRKRRRTEAAAEQRAWSGIAAAVAAEELSELATDDGPPPFPSHETHSLVTFGGYYNCIRCGAVVGWKRHDQLGRPCRGECPKGSLRPIRRLAKGLHPHSKGTETDTATWPSGEVQPMPRRLCG